MPIATSDAAARRLAASEYNLKLSLERAFMKIIRPYLRNLSREFRLFYSQSGPGFATQAYDQELANILLNHYRRTSNAFKYGLRTTSNRNVLEEQIDQIIKTYNENRSIQQAAIINRTNQKELDSYTAAAIAAALQEGESINNRDIAQTASKDFDKLVVSKSEVIASTETQNVAEATKNIEQSSIFSAGASILGLLGIGSLAYEKKWIAALDRRTRHNHAVADGQSRPQLEPFVVGGQLLSYPGDLSMGASLDNVINCRCSSILVRV